MSWASCQPASGVQWIRTMCSVKMRPKPGLASMRSRWAAATGVRTRLIPKARAEILELIVLPTVAEQDRRFFGGRGWRPESGACGEGVVDHRDAPLRAAT